MNTIKDIDEMMADPINAINDIFTDIALNNDIKIFRDKLEYNKEPLNVQDLYTDNEKCAKNVHIPSIHRYQDILICS